MIKTLKSDVYTRICTQLTFDLILGLLGISRLGTPPLSFLKHIKILYTLSMDAKMYSKMPTDFFQALDGQLYRNKCLTAKLSHWYQTLRRAFSIADTKNSCYTKKMAKTRNGYNQVPHLTQDTAWESDKNTIKHHKQEPSGQLTTR